ncbi:MAG: efflux RND transporter periplasmic adaptor subunit [Acidobacteriia bacterium]|nr:efflux RND transporter periplasmic adaptor subunit [Terriglobia bacterium]
MGTSVTPIRVETVAVTETDWPSTYEATGSIRARTTATISSKLMGYAREVRAQIGDRVREGQPLVVLDARDLDTSVARAEAGREEVKSAIPEAESAVALARAQLDLAQVTFHRIKDLLNKRSITNQEYDEASARLKAAQATLDMACARRAQSDAKMAQSEQEVRSAGIQRGYSEIIAPFSGTIITKSIDPGTLAVPGAPLFTIERAGAYRLEASVEESRLSLARVGKTVSITIDGIDRTFPARVAEVVPSVDAAARTGTVKIDLPSLPELRSGLFGRALFDTGGRKVLTVPSAGVMERGQLQSVYIAENNVAHTRLVTLGTRVKDKVEVLSGLNQGDRVIVPIPTSLADGAPIEVRQ